MQLISGSPYAETEHLFQQTSLCDDKQVTLDLGDRGYGMEVERRVRFHSGMFSMKINSSLGLRSSFESLSGPVV